MSNLHPFDIIFIAIYFLILFGIAWWAAVREKNVSSDYFLASRDVAWFAVGASLFASNIGSEHLVGLAGTGAGSGLAVGHFEWLACLILLLLGWLFVPYYLKSGVYTMPEFLEKRYNSAARSYFTWVSVIGYILTKISVTLYAGGVVIRAVTGWNFYTAAIVLIVVTGLYTVFGGLRAVVYTEVLQAIVLILGSVVLMAIGLHRVGGIAGLEAKVPAGFFSMWKPSSHPDFPWTGIIFGAPILGIWYWCTDQHIVQRVLALAKNIKQARTGTIFAGYLKTSPVFIFVLPGIVAMALFSDVSNNPDSAYPTLVTRLLPDGIKGLVLAGMLAALMSSLGLRVQRVFDAPDLGCLQEDASRCERAAARARGPDFSRGHGIPRTGLDSVDEVRLVADLHLPAERAGVHRPAHRRLLPPRPVLPAAERHRRGGIARHRARPRPAAAHPRADQQGDRRWPRGGNAVALDRDDQLPSLRRAAVRDLHGGALRREHDDSTTARHQN
jgi:SSS family transporter